MKNTFSKILSLTGLTLLGLGKAQYVAAGILSTSTKTTLETQTGLGDTSPTLTAINIISVFLGILGIVSLVIIVYAGFRWMTAGGNEDTIKEAKDMLKAAVIGALIILGSYSIAQFVFSSIESATGQGAIR